MPIHFRGAVIAILDWLASLPAAVLDGHPSLRVLSATMSLVAGRTTGVEEALLAAERGLEGTGQDKTIRDLVGRIAAARATLAVTRYQADEIMLQSRRALEHLSPENLPHDGDMGHGFLALPPGRPGSPPAGRSSSSNL